MVESVHENRGEDFRNIMETLECIKNDNKLIEALIGNGFTIDENATLAREYFLRDTTCQDLETLVE